MKKAFVLIGVAIVCMATGACVALVYSAQLTARVLLELKTQELYRSFDAVTEAARSQTAETACWALERHLQLMAELKNIGYSSSHLDTQAIVVHAQLAAKADAILEKVRRAREALDNVTSG